MAKKEVVNSSEFVNPFKAGVSYKDFVTALNGKSVKEYLAGQFKSEGVEFDAHDIEWLESEIENHK